MSATLEQQALSLWLPTSYQDPTQWRLGRVGWLDPHSPGNTGLVFSTQTVGVCVGGKAQVYGCMHGPPL